MTGALLIAETIGVAIGGTVGFLAGQRFEAERAVVRTSAYHDQVQKAIDDVGRKAKQLAQMYLQASAENKTLKEALAKLQAAPPLDLAGKNAELNRINQALRNRTRNSRNESRRTTRLWTNSGAREAAGSSRRGAGTARRSSRLTNVPRLRAFGVVPPRPWDGGVKRPAPNQPRRCGKVSRPCHNGGAC